MASLQGATDSCGEQVRPGGAQQHGDHPANHESIPGYWDVCRGKAKVIQTDTHTWTHTMIGSIEAVWRSHSVKCQSLMKLLRAVKLQIKFKRLIENPILAECVRVRQPVRRTDWPPAALRVQSRSWLHIHSETWIDLYYHAPGPRPADWLWMCREARLSWSEGMGICLPLRLFKFPSAACNGSVLPFWAGLVTRLKEGRMVDVRDSTYTVGTDWGQSLCYEKYVILWGA